jgi:hypothetical protein
MAQPSQENVSSELSSYGNNLMDNHVRITIEFSLRKTTERGKSKLGRQSDRKWPLATSEPLASSHVLHTPRTQTIFIELHTHSDLAWILSTKLIQETDACRLKNL